jgi:hypothetical protein
MNDGALQYLDALRALREFRELVLGLCDDVLRRHGNDLAKALGTEVRIDKAYNAVYPDDAALLRDQWRTAWIGRQVGVPGFGEAY